MSSTARACIFAALISAFATTIPDAHATDVGASSHPFGLGAQIGSPTGVTGKYYFGGGATAIDFLVGVGAYGRDLGPTGTLYSQASFLWHPSTLAHEPPFDIDWYIGVGGFLHDYGRYGRAAGGLHAPIGLTFDLNDPSVSRLQFYAEAALNVNLIGSYAWAGVAAGIGSRWYF